ncbi:MAG TPA: type II toxin-antitoxin system mRNA interferase toxin, RelE/StbE family [Kamptonema sp.]|nr:type II toxin-antitoxin system mRNA interferase toxin, RelE/StbE family [Kamptonema sp.]
MRKIKLHPFEVENGVIAYLISDSAEAKALERIATFIADREWIVVDDVGQEIDMNADRNNFNLKVRYQVQKHPLVESEDLPNLPVELQADFYELIEPALKIKPSTGGNLFDCHALKGKLKGYRALSIEYADIAYRLVYRICDLPAPNRVQIISIGNHDPVYEMDVERRNK